MEVESCDLSKSGFSFLLISWRDLHRASGNLFSTSRQSWIPVLVLSLTSCVISSFLLSGLQFLYRWSEDIGFCHDPCMFPIICSFFLLLRQKVGAVAFKCNSAMGDRELNIGSLQSALTQWTVIFALLQQILLIIIIIIVTIIILKPFVLTQWNMMYTFAFKTTAESFRIQPLLLGWVAWYHWTKGLRDPPTEVLERMTLWKPQLLSSGLGG